MWFTISHIPLLKVYTYVCSFKISLRYTVNEFRRQREVLVSHWSNSRNLYIYIYVKGSLTCSQKKSLQAQLKLISLDKFLKSSHESGKGNSKPNCRSSSSFVTTTFNVYVPCTKISAHMFNNSNIFDCLSPCSCVDATKR